MSLCCLKNPPLWIYLGYVPRSLFICVMTNQAPLKVFWVDSHQVPGAPGSWSEVGVCVVLPLSLLDSPPYPAVTWGDIQKASRTVVINCFSDRISAVYHS